MERRRRRHSEQPTNKGESPPMNKTELVAAIATHTQVDKAKVAAVLDGLEDVVSASVRKGEKVALTGFVSFDRVERKAAWPATRRPGSRSRSRPPRPPRSLLAPPSRRSSTGTRRPPRSTPSRRTPGRRRALGRGAATRSAPLVGQGLVVDHGHQVPQARCSRRPGGGPSWAPGSRTPPGGGRRARRCRRPGSQLMPCWYRQRAEYRSGSLTQGVGIPGAPVPSAPRAAATAAEGK